MKKKIKVLDVTLRDGGCVIDFNFGNEYMNKILCALEESRVDFIELGYIDSLKGSAQGRTQFISEKVIYNNFLSVKKPNIKYVAMIDHGKFDPELLEFKNDKSIDGIRYCFHKEDLKNVVSKCKTIIEKGYQLFIQPMITMRYSESEFSELISIVNTELPFSSGLYIVDSFGEMHFDELLHLFNIANSKLNKNISLGFHSHNNLQLSYSNVIQLLKVDTDREIMIDSSIMGMGKGAGNLNTELLLEHLNCYYNFNYSIDSLLRAIDEVINPIHSEHYWGYSVEYFLSSKYHCTPSYASHFYNKHMLSIDSVAKLLSIIEPHKRISFDKNYAENLYEQFNNENNVDDTLLIDNLRSIVKGKDILVIAPGKSISSYSDKIESFINKRNVVSFSLNMTDSFSCDFHIVTRQNLKIQPDALHKVICSSSVRKFYQGSFGVMDYNKWILFDDDGVHDSSSVLCLNLLLALDVKSIYLAGFDGFDVINSKNYYSESLRNTLSPEQAETRNKFYKKFFADLKKKVNLSFVTPSLYED